MPNSSRALILGGTRGLGYEIYQNLSARGFRAIVVGRKPCELFSHDDQFLNCDFSSETATANFLARLEPLKGTVDHFFWVSGRLERVAFRSIAVPQILTMIDVNLRNPLMVAQTLWADFQARQTATYFSVIGSTVGVSDSPRDDEAVYAATKAAQVSFTRAVGKTRRHPALKVSLFCPGGMKTEFWRDNPIEPDVLATFLDPRKVAQKIVDSVLRQSLPYAETIIPRGSL